MVGDITDKAFLTDAVKAALAGSDLAPKQPILNHSDTEADVQALKGKALAAAEDVAQLIDSGKFDDAEVQKLSGALVKLRSVLQDGKITKQALATALGEVSIAIGAAESSRKDQMLRQQEARIWHKVEQCNKEIDDDFENMRRAGIVFDDKLWRKHKELSEHMQAHPQDIDKQKELNAVDDLLLQQAEPQLKKHPNGKSHLDDAKKKSKDRHQMVDNDLAALESSTLIVNSNTKLDWTASITADGQGKDMTIDEIERPSVGQKTKIASKNITV